MEPEPMEIMIKYLTCDMLFFIIWLITSFIYLFFSNKKLPSFDDKWVFIVNYSDGTQYWYCNGLRHRVDGPAIIHPDGKQEWYQNGLLHRENGPAIIYSNGSQKWCLNGKRHREDGPAIIYPDGRQEWYLNGVKVTPMEVFEKLPDKKKENALWNLNQWK